MNDKTKRRSRTADWPAWLALGWSLWPAWLMWSLINWSFIRGSEAALLKGLHARDYGFALAHYGPVLLGALLLGGGAASVGMALLRSCPDMALDAPEWLVVGFGLGLSVFSLLLTLLAFIGGFRSPIILGMVLASSCVAIWRVAPQAIAASPPAKKARPRQPLLTGLVLLLFLAANFTILIGLLSPPIFYDALNYHLAFPSQYLLAGRFISMPFHYFSAFPKGWDILYGIGLAAHSWPLTKLLPWLGVLGILGIYYLAGGQDMGALALGMTFLVCPMVVLNLVTAGVEIGWTFFFLSSVWALCRYWDGGSVKPRWLYLSAGFAGIMLATKYVAAESWLALLTGIVYMEFVRRKTGWRMTLRTCVVFAGISLVVFSPWLVKNALLMGNPVYPFLDRWFHPNSYDPSRLQAMLAAVNWRQTGGVWDVLRKPWLDLQQRDTSEYIGVLGLWLLPLALLLPGGSETGRDRVKVLRVIFGVTWLLWCLTSSVARFFIPVFGVLIFLLCAIYENSGGRPFLRRVLVGGALAFGAAHAMFDLNNLYGWDVIFGRQSVEDFLSRPLPLGGYAFPYYPMMQRMDALLPPEAKVLFVGEARTLYSPRQAEATNGEVRQEIVELAQKAGNGERLRQMLREKGITHIFINYGEACRLDLTYHVFAWTPESRGAFDEFWRNHMRRIASENPPQGVFSNLQLFEIVDQNDAPRSLTEPAPLLALSGFCPLAIQQGTR